MTFKKAFEVINSFSPLAGAHFIDAGNIGAFANAHLSLLPLSVCYTSLAHGGMGHSLGLALGFSQITKKRSYIFIGDGSFLMNGFELHTALENEVPLTVFLFNNNSHGMCSTRENLFLSEKESHLNDFKPSFFGDGFAKLFPQIQSYEIKSLIELKRALHNKLQDESHHSVILYSLNIVDDSIPPFLTFKKHNEQIQKK